MFFQTTHKVPRLLHDFFTSVTFSAHKTVDLVAGLLKQK